MRQMRLARLAILLTFVSTCHGIRHVQQQRGLSESFTVPDTLTSSGSKTANPVNGPITAQSSASGVDMTEDMEVMDSSAGIAPRETDVKSQSNKSSSVLTDDGNADEVLPKEMSQEKTEGVIPWDLKDLLSPVCRNCKAVLDYKWILNEYSNVYGIKLFLVFAMFSFIWLLGTTARDFFVPPLLYWAERLELTPEIAGATLLAFGNCAPDIFSVVTAAHGNDLPLAVSEMLGSNMFGLCITGGVVALSCWYYGSGSSESMGIQSADASTANDLVPGNVLVVTVGVYLVTVVALAFVLMGVKPTLLKTVFLPLIYILYVYMLWRFRATKDAETAAVSEESPAACEAPLASGEGGTGDSLSLADQPPSLEGIAPPKHARPLEFACWWVTLPAYILRHACIPAVDGYWGPVRRAASAFTPLGMLAFCIITNTAWMQSMSLVALIGFVMLACLFGLCIYIGSDNRMTLPWFYPALALFALVGSVIWLSVLASEITALIEAIGFALDIPRLRLGYTAVAWGNSLTDLLVCLATVQKGHASMAITAIFAAPLIDDLIAFGVSIIMVSYEKNSVPVLCGADCPKEFKDPLITSLSFIAVAVILLACALRERGSRIKIWAGLLAALYVTFLILVLFVEKVDAPVQGVKSAPSAGKSVV